MLLFKCHVSQFFWSLHCVNRVLICEACITVGKEDVLSSCKNRLKRFQRLCCQFVFDSQMFVLSNFTSFS